MTDTFTRLPGMTRDQILAGEVTTGMTIVVGSGKRNGFQSTLMDVGRVEGSPSEPVFVSSNGKRRIYRWAANYVTVLGFLNA
jgi:hypothetical protein